MPKKRTRRKKTIMQNNNVTIFDHVLVNHKIAILRDVNTGTKQFRELIEEIATLMAFEALKDAPTKEVEVETPLEKLAWFRRKE